MSKTLSTDSTDLHKRFLRAVKKSYKNYKQYGGRSNQKLKPLHGWIQDELKVCLGDDYQLEGISETSSKERFVEGWYYRKNSDVVVSKNGIDVGVVSVKFPVQSYKKNKINMFETQLGETANLRMNNIVFGNFLLLPVPLPNVSFGKINKYDIITDDVIDLYVRVAEDYQNRHAPNVQAVAITKVNLSGDEVKTVRFARRSEVRVNNENWEHLKGILSIDRFFNVMCSQIKTKYMELSTGARQRIELRKSQSLESTMKCTFGTEICV